MNREPAATSGKGNSAVRSVAGIVEASEPGIIDKTRYPVRSGQHVFEVDESWRE